MNTEITDFKIGAFLVPSANTSVLEVTNHRNYHHFFLQSSLQSRITLSLEFTLHIFCYRLTIGSGILPHKLQVVHPVNKFPNFHRSPVLPSQQTLFHHLDNISSQINAILIPTLYVQNKSLQLHLQQSRVRAERIPTVIQVCLSTESFISYNPIHNAHK